MSTIDELRGLVERATKLPWRLATSNSWRRIVSESGKHVCEPTIYSVKDPHPDMRFRNGGEDGPDATLLLAAVNALPALLAVAEAARGVEWVPMFGESSSKSVDRCPCCNATKREGHANDCDLADALDSLDALARLDGEVGHE